MTDDYARVLEILTLVFGVERGIVQADKFQPDHVTVGWLAENMPDWDRMNVEKREELRRAINADLHRLLDDGLLMGQVQQHRKFISISRPVIGSSGLRELGLWPRDDAAQHMAAVLDELAGAAALTAEDESASRLRRAAQVIRDLGVDITSEAIASYAAKMSGHP